MVDFSKFDFSKFDMTKMFDVDSAIAAVEKNNKLAAGLIMDDRARAAAESINAAGCELVRAQIAAAKAFGAAVKQAVAA
jgi:hypothetical protein